jgi:hypothetical protein
VQVLHADGKSEVAIAVKKDLNALAITSLPVVGNQLVVAFGIIGFRLKKSQKKRPLFSRVCKVGVFHKIAQSKFYLRRPIFFKNDNRPAKRFKGQN